MKQITLADPPAGAKAILCKLNREHGMPAFIVGGCVRDLLLGKQPHDWDICTKALPEQTLQFFRDCRAIETGLKHGTVTLVIDGKQFEVTTFRKDGNYSDGRHPDSVAYVSDIETDLSRRDFTINAMAWNDVSGLVDPFGGRQDLSDGIIRCVGDPDKRFQEDGLRILRAMRFASVLGFEIEEDTREAVHRNKELLRRISAERINSELQKILLGPNVLRILLDFADVMATVIPEIQPCIGFEQNNPYLQYTVYEHIARSVAAYKGRDIVVKLALLLHDIGKPACYSRDERGGHFYGHPKVSKEIAEGVLYALKFDNKTINDVLELVGYHDATLAATPASARRWLNRLGETQAFRLIEVRKGDVYGQKEDIFDDRLEQANAFAACVQKVLSAKDCFTVKDLAINGHDVVRMGASGKGVGFILRRLLDMVMNEEAANDHDALCEAGQKLIQEIDQERHYTADE